MSNQDKYNSAITYFNQTGSNTLDGLRYTYDAEQNILIQQHENAEQKAEDAKDNGLYAGIFGILSVGGAVKWTESDSPASQAPILGTGLCLIFAVIAAKSLWERKNIVKAVDRNVAAGPQNQSGPVL